MQSPIELTSRAAEEIKKIMSTTEMPNDFRLRIGVRGGGCSGMSYILGFDRSRDHDMKFIVDGIEVFMDKRHGLYLMGTRLDYKDGLESRGFSFENPNATEQCGCGSSFSA